MNETLFEPAQALKIYGVEANNPGYIYVIESEKRLKIGRSIKPDNRLREASTWLPDAKIVGVKPFWNHTGLENCLHVGLSIFWYSKEWYSFDGDPYFQTFVDGFRGFSDSDINSNSIEFIYWMNGDGMSELVIEKNRQNASTKGFLKETSFTSKKHES